MIRYAERDRLKFWMADLRAADWVERARDVEDDAVLLKKFFAIHQYFLRNIGRERPELFKEVDRAYMLTLIRGWIRLYLAALDVLRQAYPRTDESADMEAMDVNWSALLGISFDGLQHIDFASRYAEFWAERSLKDSTIFASFDDRLRFTGSAAYSELAQLDRDKQLLVVDDFTNAVPAFDLLLAARTASGPADIARALESHGGHVVELSALSSRRLHALAA